MDTQNVDNAMEPGRDEGKLTVEEARPGVVEVFYEITTDDSLLFSKERKLTHHRELYMRVNTSDNFVEIYPIGVSPHRSNFLRSRYGSLKSIALEGFGFDLPLTGDAVTGLVADLPMGFVKDTNYGLGLKKEYEAIVRAVQSYPNVTCLCISGQQRTHVQGEVYYLAYAEFDALRKAMNRIASSYQSDGRMDKAILAHNSLLTAIDSAAYPAKVRPYKADTVFKLVKAHDLSSQSLSKADADAVVDVVTHEAREIAKAKPQKLLRLRNYIELVTLQELISQFEKMLSGNLAESKWQRFFDDHPFILSLAFAFPVVKVGERLYVGGIKLSGAGSKIADFLFRHGRTGNVALVEIKTPDSPLLGRAEYRPGVYAPALDLSGGINQLLDQRYQFQRSVAALKDTSGQHELESYAVHCILVIGNLPSDTAKRKSFELVRHGTKDVEIVTFDELLGKLQSLAEFLSTREDCADPSTV